MAHHYQTLVREITTPTLPTFVSSCLNVISSKPSGKGFNVPLSLTEVIFRSFATLLPRHPTIYRPFIPQIRNITKPFVAPTLADGFVSSSLVQSARCLVVRLHQAVPKGAGGEEWNKALRELVKGVHVTADQVFRAVIEDWESIAGYVSDPVDVNQDLCGGGRTPDDLPCWNGITSGVQRLVGLLGLLAEYLRNETSIPVSIPLGAIIDMTTRLLSVTLPAASRTGTVSSNLDIRLHPAIERDERDRLWSGIPSIHIAALQVISSVADRLQENFISQATPLLDHLAWIFPSGRHDPALRLVTYQVLLKILLCAGQGLGRDQISKLSKIIRSCCKDILPQPEFSNSENSSDVINSNGKRPLNHTHNADNFLQQEKMVFDEFDGSFTDVVLAANALLPLFMTQISQQYLDVSIRSLLERTAILSHNEGAMLASILNPFLGKNGKSITSIMPHMARQFKDDSIVELLLRPRLPLVTSRAAHMSDEEVAMEGSEDEDAEMHHDTPEAYSDSLADPTQSAGSVVLSHEHDSNTMSKSSTRLDLLDYSNGPATPAFTSEKVLADPSQTMINSASILTSLPESQTQDRWALDGLQNARQHLDIAPSQDLPEAVGMENDGTDSDEESVHLTMGLDTDSDTDA